MIGSSGGQTFRPGGLHYDEEEYPDDILSDADAVASLDGELFSDGEEDPGIPQTSTRPRKAWKVDHSSGNYKYMGSLPSLPSSCRHLGFWVG